MGTGEADVFWLQASTFGHKGDAGHAIPSLLITLLHLAGGPFGEDSDLCEQKEKDIKRHESIGPK